MAGQANGSGTRSSGAAAPVTSSTATAGRWASFADLDALVEHAETVTA